MDCYAVRFHHGGLPWRVIVVGHDTEEVEARFGVVYPDTHQIDSIAKLHPSGIHHSEAAIAANELRRLERATEQARVEADIARARVA